MMRSFSRLVAAFAAVSFSCLACTTLRGESMLRIPVPVDGAAPLQSHWKSSPYVQSLNGVWKFQLSRRQVYRWGPFSADHFHWRHRIYRGMDGDGQTGTAFESVGNWWQVDLGKPSAIDRVELTLHHGKETVITGPFQSDDRRDGREYTFRIDGSTDGEKFAPVKQLTIPRTETRATIQLDGASARYLRLVYVDGVSEKNGSGGPASFNEIAIYPSGQTEPFAWKTEDYSKCAELMTEPADDFFKPEFNVSGWRDIPVPSNWEMAFFSQSDVIAITGNSEDRGSGAHEGAGFRKVPQRIREKYSYTSPPTFLHPDNAEGSYRRTFTVPEKWAGRRVILAFEGVNNGAHVYVNGTKAGYHESGFTPFWYDITDLLKPGENVLAVHVAKKTFSCDLDTGDFWFLGGIFRDVYLYSVPQNHITDMRIRTTMAGAVECALQQSGDVGQVGLTLYDAEGKAVASATAPGDGSATLNVPQPKLWSAEKPYLYTLVVRSDNETLVEKVGLREVTVKDGVFLFNGKPVKLPGMARHEIAGGMGKALTEELMLKDMRLMKACNILIDRTAHYNPDPFWMELCDSQGMYVMLEIPYCWADSHDPEMVAEHVKRTRETLRFFKNHPSNICWSLGNEPGYGKEIDKPGSGAAAVIEQVERYDPQRPFMVAWSGHGGKLYTKNPLRVLDYHYYKAPEIAAQSSPVARFFSEYPGSKNERDVDPEKWENPSDLAKRGLYKDWEAIRASKYIFGGTIWHWSTQMNYKTWGLVDAWRNIRPQHYWAVWAVYSPVKALAAEAVPADGVIEVPVENRYYFTNLNELKWQIESGQIVAAPDVDPDSRGTLRIRPDAGAQQVKVTVSNPAGEYPLARFDVMVKQGN